ncbi:hypothetical protein VM636_15195 [Streptomyces sp. SCSIO 75703]|uniref:hypothetical protein n=1 Tax=unclassified Streptomyces TaxID=2593676 RepID=UPI0006B59AB7|nr:hypothetical protein [Streptomyces sp. TP-A0875]
MPQHVQITRVCRDCDGFATAAVTTGTHHSNGTRVTLRITCPTCKGTGHTIPAASLTRTGR